MTICQKDGDTPRSSHLTFVRFTLLNHPLQLAESAADGGRNAADERHCHHEVSYGYSIQKDCEGAGICRGYIMIPSLAL